MLLDCGEGTFGQLVHHYGAEAATRKVTPQRACKLLHPHTAEEIVQPGMQLTPAPGWHADCQCATRTQAPGPVQAQPLPPSLAHLLLEWLVHCTRSKSKHPAPVRMAAVQVEELQALWISHKHADHMLGVQGILEARHVGQPLLVSTLSCFGQSQHAWLSFLAPSLPSVPHSCRACHRARSIGLQVLFVPIGSRSH